MNTDRDIVRCENEIRKLQDHRKEQGWSLIGYYGLRERTAVVFAKNFDAENIEQQAAVYTAWRKYDEHVQTR